MKLRRNTCRPFIEISVLDSAQRSCLGTSVSIYCDGQRAHLSSYREHVIRISRNLISRNAEMKVSDSRKVRRQWAFRLPTVVVGLAILVVASFTVMPFHIDASASPSHVASETASGLNIRGLDGDPYGVHTAIRV